MINLSNVAAAQAESYYRADDYYTNDNPPAEWYGQGAAALGLDEANASRDFGDLLRGKLPNGEEIPGGQGGRRRAGTDLTISAPKSVSIAALVNGDPRVTAAHQEAVRVALAEVEKRIQARISTNGQVQTVTTGSMVARTVLHDTSRNGDPNLHTHCVLLNVTQTADGQWRAMENRSLFSLQRELDLVYKSELAVSLAKLGYQLRSTRSGVELANVSDTQIEAFSTRKAEVDEALKARGKTRETSTAQEREKAALNTRERKVSYDRDALRERYRKQGHEIGLDMTIPLGPLPGTLQEPEIANVAAADYAVEHLGEREQAWSALEFKSAALASGGWGSLRLSDLDAEMRRREEDGSLVAKADGLLTTAKAQNRERAMLGIEQRGRGAMAPLTGDKQALAQALDSSQLNDKQRSAVEMLLTTENRLCAIQGRAGVGKTTLLNVFREQAEAAGYKILGVAPSHSAVQALAEAGIKGTTLQSWEAKGEDLDENTILLIDESSLISTQQLLNAAIKAEWGNARMVLVGDTGQYQSVDAGSAFSQLQNAGMQTAIVDKMLRQQRDELRLVAQLAAEGRGSEALLALGDSVQEITERTTRHNRIAADYAALSPEERANTLILTGSNADRRALNSAVREAIGMTTECEKIEVFERGDLTAAQQKRAVEFKPGDAVRVEKQYRGRLVAQKGEIWRVTAVERNEVVIERNGVVQRFAPATLSGKGITVGSVSERECAVGERLRITGDVATANKETLRNGQRVSVVAITDERIQLKVDGRKKLFEIPRGSPINAEYGYAATGHSAQGLGANRVFLERDSHCRSVSERQFYTDVTRVKEELRVYTDSRVKLAKSVHRQTHKTIALDDHKPPVPKLREGMDKREEGPIEAVRPAEVLDKTQETLEMIQEVRATVLVHHM